MATFKCLRKQNPSLVSTALTEIPKPKPPSAGKKSATRRVARRSSRISAKTSRDFETTNSRVGKEEPLYYLGDDGKVYQVSAGAKAQREEEPVQQQAAKLMKKETRIKALIRQARAEANASYTNGVYKGSDAKAAEEGAQHPLADARMHQQALPEQSYYFGMEDDVSSSDLTEDYMSSQIDSMLAEGLSEQELLAKMEVDTDMLIQEEMALMERIEKEKEFLKRAEHEGRMAKVSIEVEKLRLKRRHDELAISLAAATRKRSALRAIRSVMEKQQARLEKQHKRVTQQKLEEEKFEQLLTSALDMQIERKKLERKRMHARRQATKERASADIYTQTPYSWDSVRPPSAPKPSNLPTRKTSYRKVAPIAAPPVARKASEKLRESQRVMCENLRRCSKLLDDTMDRVTKYMRSVGVEGEQFDNIASEISQRFTESMQSCSNTRVSSSMASMRSKKSSETKLPRVDTSSRVNLTAVAAAREPTTEELKAKVKALTKKVKANRCTVSISASTRNFLKEEWAKVVQETKQSEKTLRELQKATQKSLVAPTAEEPLPLKEMCETCVCPLPEEQTATIEANDTTQAESAAPAPTEEVPIEAKKQEKAAVDGEAPLESQAHDFDGACSATTLGMLSQNWSDAREPQNQTLDFDEDEHEMCDPCDSFCRPPTPPVYHAPLLRHMSRQPVSKMSLRSIREGVTSDFSKEFSSPLVSERHVVPYQSLTTRFGLRLVDLPSNDEEEPKPAEEEAAQDGDALDNAAQDGDALDDAAQDGDALDDAAQDGEALDDAAQDGDALDDAAQDGDALEEAAQDGDALEEAAQDFGEATEEDTSGEVRESAPDMDDAIIAYEFMDAASIDRFEAQPFYKFDDIDMSSESSTASTAVAHKLVTQTTSLHRAQRFSDPNVEHMAVQNSPISPLTSTASTGKLAEQLSSVLSSVSFHSAPEEREIHFPHGVEEEDSLIAITVLHEPAAHEAEKPFVTANRSDPGPKKQAADIKAFASQVVKKALNAALKEVNKAAETPAAALESKEGSPALPDEVEQANASLVMAAEGGPVTDTIATEDSAQTTPKVSSTTSMAAAVAGDRVITTSFSRSVSRASARSVTPEEEAGEAASTVSLKEAAAMATPKNSDADVTKKPSKASLRRKRRKASKASLKASATEVTEGAAIAVVEKEEATDAPQPLEAALASPKASATEVAKEASTASVKRRRRRKSSSASLKSKKGSAASLKQAEGKEEDGATELATKSAASLKDAQESNEEPPTVLGSAEDSSPEKETTVKSTESLKEAEDKVVSEEAKAESYASATAEEGETKESPAESAPLTDEALATSPEKEITTEVATKEASSASVGDTVAPDSPSKMDDDAQAKVSSYADVTKKFSVHSVETPTSSEASSPKVSSTEMPTSKSSTESVRRRRKKKRGSAASLKSTTSQKNSSADVANAAVPPSVSNKSMQSVAAAASAVVPSASKTEEEEDRPKLAVESSVTSIRRQASGALTPKVSYAEMVKQNSVASVVSREDIAAVKPKLSTASLKAGPDKQPSTASLKSTGSSSVPRYSDIAKGLSAASVKSGKKTPAKGGSAVDVAEATSSASIKKEKRSTASLSKAAGTEPMAQSMAPSAPSKDKMEALQAVARARSKRSVKSSSRKSSAASLSKMEQSSPVPSIEITTADYFEEPIAVKTSKASKSSSRSSLKKRSSRSSSRASNLSTTVGEEAAVKTEPSAGKVSRSSSRSSIKKGSATSLNSKAASVTSETEPASSVASETQAARSGEAIATYASKVSQKSASAATSEVAIKSQSRGGSAASVGSLGAGKLDASSSKEQSASKASMKSTISAKTSPIDAIKLADLSSSSFKVRKGSKASLKKKTSPRVSAASVVSQKSVKEVEGGAQDSTTESS